MSKGVSVPSKKELTQFKKRSSDWTFNKKETQISKIFAFDDYIKGLIFMARISVHAEVMKHHPDLTLSYGKVKVVLTTHDLKTLSTLDLKLAGKIDSLYG